VTLDVGSEAPDFTLPGLDGRSYRLRDALARGPVLLVFAKSECGATGLAYPYLERLHRAYPRDRWQLLGILQDTPEDAREFAGQLGLTLPIVTEEAPWEVSRAYDPEATPTLFLVEPGGVSGPIGRVARVSAGFRKSDLNELSAEVARRLGVAPVEVAPADDGKPAFRPG
jgi:peroxiredoxin